jgi:vesicle-fusing ATPase
LVKSASSFALNRHVKVGTVASVENVKDLQVLRQDFMNALDEVRPAFGISEEELASCVANHIIPFAPHVERIQSDGELFVSQIRKSKRRFNMSVLLHGPAGSGKTALAAQIAMIAKEEEKPFIKLVTPENMVGSSESAKVYTINKIFQDSYKSPFSVIVIDAIERLIDWVSIGPRFSNMVVQCLLVLLRKKPPKNRRLLILATTNDRRLLDQLEFGDVFDSEIYVPNISDLDAVDNVLKYVYAEGEAPAFNDADRARINRILKDASMDSKLSIGIKKLQLVIEMAKQDMDPVERFCNELHDWSMKTHNTAVRRPSRRISRGGIM